jgi:hypothetical protein
MLGGCQILLTKSSCLDSIGGLTAYVCSCRDNDVCGLSEAGNLVSIADVRDISWGSLSAFLTFSFLVLPKMSK